MLWGVCKQDRTSERSIKMLLELMSNKRLSDPGGEDSKTSRMRCQEKSHTEGFNKQ